MARRRTRTPPEFVIWAVAFASILGSILQAADALLDARHDKAGLWLVGAGLGFVLAVAIERYKGTRGR